MAQAPIIPPDIKIKNETDIYNHIGFTDDEIAQIIRISIPSYTEQLLSCDGKTLLNGKEIIKTKSNVIENVIETETENIEEYSPNKSREVATVEIASTFEGRRCVKRRAKWTILLC